MPSSEFEHATFRLVAQSQPSTLPRAPNTDSDMYNLDPGAFKHNLLNSSIYWDVTLCDLQKVDRSLG
jgi:hypothetical protein